MKFPHEITPSSVRRGIRDSFRPLAVGLEPFNTDDPLFCVEGNLTEGGLLLVEDLIDASKEGLEMLDDIYQHETPPDHRRLEKEDFYNLLEAREAMRDIHLILRGTVPRDQDGGPEGGPSPGLMHCHSLATQYFECDLSREVEHA